MIKYLFIIWLISTQLFYCFGSIGNSEKEKAKSFSYLLNLLDNQRISIEPELYFYDDQGDSDLSSFTINSGNSNTQYNVKILSTKFVLGEIGFRINPIAKPFGYPLIQRNEKDLLHTELGKTHTPYTLPLELPSDNPYSKVYTFSINQELTNFTNNNFSDFTGDLHRFSLGRRTDIPVGIVSLTIVKWSRWEIQFEVDGNKIYILRLDGGTENITPRCKIEWKTSPSVNSYQLGVRFSSLFKDRFESGVRTPLLEDISALPTNTFIGELSQSNIFNLFLKNLQATDSVWIQHVCF